MGKCFHTTALMPLVADMTPVALRGRYMAMMGPSCRIGLAPAAFAGTRLLAVSPSGAMVAASGLAAAAVGAVLALGRRLPSGISRTPLRGRRIMRGVAPDASGR